MTVTLDRAPLDLIVRFETGGRDYYEKFLSAPSWPGYSSGITLGVGYDLGFVSEEEFFTDWHGLLSGNDLRRLRRCVGSYKGRVPEARLRSFVRSFEDIKVPWDSAYAVFERATLPKFIDLTYKVIPGSDKLKPIAFGVLVSLVFNRGPGMDGSRKVEMRKIRDLVAAADYVPVAEQIRIMRRLWPSTGTDSDLYARRTAEAKLWMQDYPEAV